MSPQPRARTYAALALIAVCTVAALGLETLLRHWLFPPELEEIRQWLRPTLTPWTWLAPPAAVLMTALGVVLHRSMTRRRLAALDPESRDETKVAAIRFDTLMLSTSAPQIPALVATLSFMMGSSLTPVLVTMAVAMAGVSTIGWLAMRELPAR